jgi:hypothetical protein
MSNDLQPTQPSRHRMFNVVNIKTGLVVSSERTLDSIWMPVFADYPDHYRVEEVSAQKPPQSTGDEKIEHSHLHSIIKNLAEENVRLRAALFPFAMLALTRSAQQMDDKETVTVCMQHCREAQRNLSA